LGAAFALALGVLAPFAVPALFAVPVVAFWAAVLPDEAEPVELPFVGDLVAVTEELDAAAFDVESRAAPVIVAFPIRLPSL